MADTLLDELSYVPGIYQLGQHTPVSMRDQIVRASYLVDRLFRRKTLGRTSKLAVIGGGVAGITVTLRALDHGIAGVDMVEQADDFMFLQKSNDSRMIDPVQYDWPASHWEKGRWPVPEISSPRRYTAVAMLAPADLGTETGAKWAETFKNLIEPLALAGTKLRFHPHRKAQKWSRLGTADRRLLLPLVSTNGEAPSAIRADVIIFAGGFGAENASLKIQSDEKRAFEGIPFWATDRFQEHDFGIDGLERGVLVAGSGDGALQDYVRLATGLDTCAEVLKTVLDDLASNAWRKKIEDMWHWEDHAQRARRIAWPNELHFIQERLHARYQELVDELVKSSDWSRIRQALDDKIGKRSLDKVYLAYKCNHFSWCYGLNHLVALIVMAYARARSGKRFEPALPCHAAIATQNLGHVCERNCWGHRHPVVLGKNVHCHHDDDALKHWPEKDRYILTYEGLVIRYGIKPMTMLGEKVTLCPQQIPFHLP